MTFLRLLEVFTYIWLSLESAVLAHLYNWGFNRMKKTPIVRSLRNVLYTLCAVSLLRIWAALVEDRRSEILSCFGIVCAFLLVLALRNFRRYSTQEEGQIANKLKLFKKKEAEDGKRK
jgi:hypothetical protein